VFGELKGKHLRTYMLNRFQKKNNCMKPIWNLKELNGPNFKLFKKREKEMWR
jgi:hypothetical protein